MRIVVDERIAARLVDRVEQWVPVKHRQHEGWQGVGHEHLTRGDHVRALVDGGEDADSGGKPGFDRQQNQAQRHAGKPGKQKHSKGLYRLFNFQWDKGDVIDKQDKRQRQYLDVECADGGGHDRDRRVHRRMLHHRAGRAFGTDHRAEGLGVGHVEEDPRHDVHEEITPDSRTAQAEDREHHVECQHEDHRLQHVHYNRDERIVVGLADGSDHRMIDQFQNDDRGADPGPGFAFRLKHSRSTSWTDSLARNSCCSVRRAA